MYYGGLSWAEAPLFCLMIKKLSLFLDTSLDPENLFALWGHLKPQGTIRYGRLGSRAVGRNPNHLRNYSRAKINAGQSLGVFFNFYQRSFSIEILKRDNSSVSFYRVLPAEESAKRLRVLAPGEFEDVVLRPSHRRECGNVGNVSYRLKSAWWYEWGYIGDGPRDTGLNILFHFSNERLAREFVHEFVEGVLAKLPKDKSVAISARFIIEWINARKGKVPNDSYEFPDLCPQGQTWEFGGWGTVPQPLFVD